MAWIWADRVLDTSATTGTGSLVVSGTSPLGWRTFSTVCAVADTFYYTIHDPVTGAWETGEGTYSALNTVARTVVRASSNAGALVSFAANTKNVFIDVIGYWFGTTLPAEITVPAGAVAYGDATGTTGVTGVLADLGWDVANKRLAIGGATPATTLDVRGAATVYSLATNRLTNTIGSVGFTPGDATHTGYVAFYNAAGTRQSYIGYSQPIIGYNAEITGGYHNFTCLDGPSRFTLASNRIAISSPDTLNTLTLIGGNTLGGVYNTGAGATSLNLGTANAYYAGLSTTALYPYSNKLIALGTASNVWNGLHTASVVAYGATSGTITVNPPAVAGANTITWPAATGTVALTTTSAVTVSATVPGSPFDGQLWWNSDASVGGGQLMLRYNDGVGASQWVPASPGVGSGAVVQTVSTQTGAVATGTALIPHDDTIPQIGEGNEYMTLSITPKSATNRLIIEVTWIGANSVTNYIGAALFQDAIANALAVGTHYQNSPSGFVTISFRHTMTSGTTSATTFRVRAGGHAAGTTTFNGFTGGRIFGGTMASSIVIQEVL